MVRTVTLVAFILSLCWVALSATPASAKEVIAYFGTEVGSGTAGGQFKAPGDIAVNSSDAGSANLGDIYVIDSGNNRIQRFAQDDNGTPSDPYDDKYLFVSAWGMDVDGSSGAGGYEICAVAANCKAAVASGGNGAASGNGALSGPSGIAVDQDTGHVYVFDVGNLRVNVYSGEGSFLRSFGWDVVGSGPGDVGASFEICVTANGDVCKAGVAGAGLGQIGSMSGVGPGIALSPPDGNAEAGAIFLPDQGNRRVNTYALDGSSPASFGSAATFAQFSPEHVAVDSRGIVYISDREHDSEIDRYDSKNANGGSVGFLAPIPAPPLSTVNTQRKGLEVDPDSDGPGPDVDVLYVVRDGGQGTTVIQQFGPVNAPGLVTPPVADDEEHGALVGFNFIDGLGLDPSSGRLFVSTLYNVGGPYAGAGVGDHGVYVLDKAGGPPSATLDAISEVTAISVKVHATVEPNGPPPVSYWVEYSKDGVKWTSTPPVLVGTQEVPQSIEATLSPPPGGLEPNTFYQVRIGVSKVFSPPATTAALSFKTLEAPPVVETAGAPVRSATAAQLNGRVNPRGKATTYHFEYGHQGSCDANPCLSTDPQMVPAGGVSRLVSAEVTELEPNTAYHYRLVADNGVPGSPVAGENMTVRTSVSDEALSHGDFPGPPGSDRAYEMVSLPNSGGNPVFAERGGAFSDQGNRVVYSLSGGTPISDTGSIAGFYFAERGHSGWETKSISPPRTELVGPTWSSVLAGPGDLSTINVKNSSGDDLRNTIWRLSPQGTPTRLFDVTPPVTLGVPEAPLSQVVLTASESPRVVVSLALKGSAKSPVQLYDVTSGSPVEPVNLLPSGDESSCTFGQTGAETAEFSSDGRYLVFASRGNGPCGNPGAPYRLYLRDLETQESRLISPSPLSGVDCGSARTLRLTTEELFFWTFDRLSAEDTPAIGCGFGSPKGDIYRYDLDTSALECVTCPLASFDVDVEANMSDGGGPNQIAVARDGSRIYFRSVSKRPLVAGASTGSDSTYVLNNESDQLGWVGAGIAFGQGPMTKDGSVVLFTSEASSLNPVGGTSDNGGTSQLYRYDDTDRSLVCISCPQNGLPSSGPVQTSTVPSEDGSIVGFSTPLALLSRDQNTPPVAQSPARGTDVYEWRDGRLFLITDGLTDWTDFAEPKAIGLSPSGRDLFFTAYAQYTPDALDAYNRIYDARIGGGFEYPEPPVPCPLEVCQGTPKGAPEEAPPGTGAVSGPGNRRPSSQATKSRCPKGKRLVRKAGKARCAKRPAKKQGKGKANRDRRAGR